MIKLVPLAASSKTVLADAIILGKSDISVNASWMDILQQVYGEISH